MKPMTNPEMAKRARKNFTKQGLDILDMLGGALGYGIILPAAVGGAAGYGLDKITEPDKDDFKALQQREKLELLRQLAAETNARARELEESSIA